MGTLAFLLSSLEMTEAARLPAHRVPGHIIVRPAKSVANYEPNDGTWRTRTFDESGSLHTRVRPVPIRLV